MPRYTWRNGAFVVHRNQLPECLRIRLSGAERMDACARDHRQKALQMRAEGQPEHLVRSRGALADACEVFRELHLRELWAFYREEAPSGLRFDLIHVEE